MARRRKGNPVHGWLVVDKPACVSSAAVVNKARWALRAQKAGHSGTLDPAATGCLVIGFGEATKLIPVAQDGWKTYRFHVRWGQATTTDDAAGTQIASSDKRPDRHEIEAALPHFIGRIAQVPPAVSAVKVDGARAYDLARKGRAFELAARPLDVSRLVLLEMFDPDHASFELVCGKGGYVRSIARDLGETLGCLGHVRELRRFSAGPFDLDGALGFADFDAVRDGVTIPTLLPLESALVDLPEIVIGAEEAADIRLGRRVPIDVAPDGDCRAWASHEGGVVALGKVTGNLFQPDRVIVYNAD